ncbi:MAG: hypothetical protein WED07_00550 [Candidatus Freyarchaeum deiterrae]
MTELKISDFKMFEKVPQKIPDSRALVEACMIGIKESEKFYGPIYTTLFIKSVINFASKKIGEKPPEGIKDVSQLTEYLVSISNKYPVPANAIVYAGMEVGNLLEGQNAAGLRVGTNGATRSMSKSLGSAERKVDAEGVISQYRQATVAMKIAHQEVGYKQNKDGTIDVLWKCYFIDACQSSKDKGFLKRSDGGLKCVNAQFVCQLFKLSTGYDCDYDLLELDKSHCINRIYMI